MRAFSLPLAIIASALRFVGVPLPVFAQTTKDLLNKNLQQAGETGAGYSAAGKANPLSLVTNVITVVLSLLGIIFLVITIYGGYRWMLARGNEQEVEKAKGTLTTGIIGMGIVLGAYIISFNVLKYLLTAAGQNVSFF